MVSIHKKKMGLPAFTYLELFGPSLNIKESFEQTGRRRQEGKRVYFSNKVKSRGGAGGTLKSHNKLEKN